MSPSFCLIRNPAASRGRGGKALEDALRVLMRAGATVGICESSSLPHAAALAGDAVARGETVVAVGGDGLVGALAAAVAAAGGVLGIIPAGRGNDFARMLGVPTPAAAAAQLLVTGRPTRVDLIAVRAGNGAEVTVAGSVYLGLISEGGQIANTRRWAAGPLGYQLAGVAALLSWRPATFTVRNGAAPPTTFPGLAVVVANSAFLAAGAMAAPDADVRDGLLDVVTVRQMRRLSFLKVMLLARSGRHVRLRQVATGRAASVVVTADRAMPAAADGETLPCASPLAPGLPLRIRVLPGALRVITPAPGTRGERGRSPLAAGDRAPVPAAEEGLDEIRAR